MRRDPGEDLAEERLDLLPRYMGLDLLAQLVDKIDQFAMLIVDVGYSGLEFLAPLNEWNALRYLKRKPPCSALKSMAKFCHGLRSASTRWSKSNPSLRLLSRSFASMT